MATIEKHIIDALQSQNKLVVPDFGCFLVVEAQTEAHPVTHQFKPGSKVVTFTEEIKEGEENLATVLAFYEHLPYEQAQEQVKGFVYDVRQRLKETGNFYMKGLGTLRIDKEFNLTFDFDKEADFSDYTFGLPQIEAKPARRPGDQKAKDSEQNYDKQKRSERRSSSGKVPVWVYIVLPLMLFVIVFLVVFNNQNASKMGMISAVENPEKQNDEAKAYIDQLENDQKTTTSTKAENKKQEEDTAKLKAKPAPSEAYLEENDSTMDYHVIAASFRLQENAQEFVDMVSKKGFTNTKIFQPEEGKTSVKVSVGKFESQRRAVEQIAKWNDTYGSIGGNQVKDWWVMKIPKEKTSAN